MTHDCEQCDDTGVDTTTGYRHADYDELGCTLCNEPGGYRCCSAVGANGQCSNCGHPVERLQ